MVRGEQQWVEVKEEGATMKWWAWLWIAALVGFTVAASWDDFEERVPGWKIVVDAVVGTFAACCVGLGMGSWPAGASFKGLHATIGCVALSSAVWMSARGLEEYRRISTERGIATPADYVISVITTATVAILHIPAWWMAWRATA